ncbi:hypothetical protein LIER_25630 [Lithospermum erythrorhizon]|uniref:Reverse transcriptase zinc-binding domain-containing protein n=1 Tax=Lithospermum erythrorhizon TaxID=34254 RepID=A0AAV3R9I1_LITER
MKRNGELRGASVGECSVGCCVDPCWKRLWGMKIPPRVKAFIWKCIHNIFPTKERFRRKGVQTDSGCVFCKDANEDLFAEHNCHENMDRVACDLWYIWKARNEVVFQGGSSTTATTLENPFDKLGLSWKPRIRLPTRPQLPWKILIQHQAMGTLLVGVEKD